MRPRHAFASAVLAALVLLATGCADNAARNAAHTGSGTGSGSGTPTSHPSCHSPVGGRCAGPEAVDAALLGQLTLDHTGRALRGTFLCGGRLTGAETADRVIVTYLASAVGAGGMTCARVGLGLTLLAPVGHRTVVDGVTGRTLPVVRL